ncbi:MAG: 3-isopropylmalate dehydrogenase, partial [Elusimicrobiota bacterium]|nr:3-isopropylmalate dehydrogenase [Elusimicrobiota bacterium]
MKTSRHHNSYIKAYEDIDFLKSDPARPVRLQLELLKPEIILEEHNIEDGIACFGSARIKDKADSLKHIKKLEEKLRKKPKDQKLKEALREAKGLDKLSKYYG